MKVSTARLGEWMHYKRLGESGCTIKDWERVDAL